MIPKVNHDLCIGCGTCEGICPSVFELRNDGFSHVIDGSSCPDSGCCEEAAEECPAGVVSLE